MKTEFLTVANVLFWTVVVLWLPFAVLVNTFYGLGSTFGPTLGARAFLAVGTLFVPSLAMVGYVAGHGITRFAKAAALLGVGVVALALAAILAKVAHPDYPHRGPHELVAVAMVLPAVVLPIGVIALWRRFEFPSRAWLFCSAWAALLLGAVVLFFGQDLELKLPLSVSVRRWEHDDIQDFSRYFLRADGVNAAEAAGYAKAFGLTKQQGSLGCAPQEASEWSPPRGGDVWVRDDRTVDEDRQRYPEGLAGCFTRMTWGADSLYVCEICDWGI